MQLTSAFNSKTNLQLNALVLPFITKYRQKFYNSKNAWSHLKSLEMADNFREVPSEIDLLLGANIFSEIVLNGLVKGPSGTSMAKRTIFGWIISRPIAKYTIFSPRLQQFNLSSQICLISATLILFVLCTDQGGLYVRDCSTLSARYRWPAPTRYLQ